MPTYEPIRNSSRCAKVPHVGKRVSKLARYAREFHLEQSSLATLVNSTRRARRANERSLEQGNFMTKPVKKWSKCAMNGPFNRGITRRKLPKNDQNGQRTDPSTGEFREKSAEKRTKSAKPGKKRQKTPDPPRGIAKYPGIPYPVRRRTLPEL